MQRTIRTYFILILILHFASFVFSQTKHVDQGEANDLFHQNRYKEAIEVYSNLFSTIDQNVCEKEWLQSLHNWGMAKIFSKDQSGFDQLLAAENCARNLGLEDICANFILDRSEIYKFNSNFAAAKNAILEALKLNNLPEQTKGEIYAQLALNTRDLRNDSCAVFANKAIEIGIALQDTSILVSAHSALAIFEKNNNYFHKAIHWSQKSLQYQQGNFRIRRAQTFFNIAELFNEIGDLNRAQNYIDSTLINFDQEKYVQFYGRINVSEAMILRKQGKKDEALIKFQESLNRNKNPFLNMRCYQSMASIEAEKGNTAKSNEYNNSAIILCKQSNSERFENRCILLKSDHAFNQGKYSTSFTLAKSLSRKENIQLYLSLLPEINLLLAKNYSKLGLKKESLKEYKNYYALKDSLNQLINNELFYTLENKYIAAKQDTELTRLTSQNKVQDLKLSQQRWKGYAILGFFTLFSGAFISLTRQNKKIKSQTQIITEDVEEKNILLKEIHHRVKNNLQVISSLFKLQSRYISDESALNALQEGRNRVNSMAILHQNLYQEDHLKGIEMGSYIDQLCDSILQSTLNRNIHFAFKNDIQSLILDIDTVIPLGLILTEFISKSLKQDYQSVSEPTITISLVEKEEKLILTVIDNGQPIQEDHGLNQSFSQKIIDAFSIKLNAHYDYETTFNNKAILVVRKYKKTISI